MNSRKTSLFAAFAAARVEYAVVGGVAVNAYGYQRATRDLDVLIRPTMDNAERAYQALAAIGVPLEGLGPDDLLLDYENIRYGPDEDHVDVLSSIGTMPFDQVWRNRNEVIIAGVVVPFISKEDLMENKREVGRLRDLADVEELELLPNTDPDAQKI